MAIDFKNEVLKRKEEIIKDLQGLIRINSELTSFDPNRVGAPFGLGNKEALDYMLNMGSRDGFKTLNVDGYAGHIEYGNSNDFVGIIGHLDVVPAGNDWSFGPYDATIHDGKMYGRGTEDDKGPTIAAYYAMKILKELNVPLSKRVKLILGLDEESGWRCVNYYFKKHPEQPVSGFIPDADFPLIYAEKGIVNLHIKGNASNDKIVSFKGGFRSNMVPDYAEVVLTDVSVADAFKTYISKNNIIGSTSLSDNKLTLKLSGKSAHGSTPEFGMNALTMMNTFLVQSNITNELVIYIDKFLTGDTAGKKLGIAYHDEEMGPLTNNFGVLTFENGAYEIVLNTRYPNGTSLDAILPKVEASIDNGTIVEVHHHQKLLYNNPNSPLVKTLMDVYIKHTGDVDAKPITIGGGTFARAMDNVVAFGPHFLGKPSYIHQKDEYIEIEDFIKATIIYTEALYELAK